MNHYVGCWPKLRRVGEDSDESLYCSRRFLQILILCQDLQAQ